MSTENVKKLTATKTARKAFRRELKRTRTKLQVENSVYGQLSKVH